MNSRRKVLVCGASGFIGRNVIDRLSARSDMKIYGTYFKTTPDQIIQNNGRITLLRTDLTQKDQVNDAVKGMDIVIQAAAVTTGSKDVVNRPYIHVTDNAVMNSIIFRACFEHRVKHVVFLSCTTMYPEQERPVKEEDFNYQIIDRYFGVGWTKVYIEKMCEFYSRISNTKYTAIRHSNIYGPYDKFDLERSHVFGATVTKVMTAGNGKIVVWGDGSDERDLLYVSDLVDFVESVIDKQQDSFELINIGCSSSISVKNLVLKIIEMSQKDIAVEFDKTKPAINFKLSLDVGKARLKYKWKPKVSLEEGIKRTLLWYRHHIQQPVLKEFEKTHA
ncbi:MAG: NAD-dependent epimerase/dehydratase family protein [Chloroflexi bacterium]|nr:NAD-dependent epimerase/dehydratase family protein [Chloroflexota bacterium]